MQRILMANHHLWCPGGTEMWTQAVSHELVSRGYDVEVLAQIPGRFASVAFDCPVIAVPTGRYDLALVNQNSSMPAALAVADRIILTCHGVHVELEQPVPGADRYVAVSEEVAEHLATLGYAATVIRNPIDCRRFSPWRPIDPAPGRVLSLCHGDEAHDLVERVCRLSGTEFLRLIGGRMYGVEALMNEADVVVGVGRTAAEAMACGRAVIVLDSRPYAEPCMDGIVLPETAAEMAKSNFSGRRYRLPMTETTLLEQLERYRRDLGDQNRRFVLENMPVERQVDRYLELALEIEPRSAKPRSGGSSASAPSSLEYISDDPDYRHLEDRERFKALYEEVGTVEANLTVRWRYEWMKYFFPAPDSTILELGAHNGPNLIHYAHSGHRVDGVEVSDTLRATFAEALVLEPADVRARVRMFPGWIEEFRADSSYDWVLCTEILEHVVDPVAVLRVARESLSEAGKVYISSPTSHWGNNTHVRGVSPEGLVEWLAKAGLEAEALFVEDDRTFCIAASIEAEE